MTAEVLARAQAAAQAGEHIEIGTEQEIKPDKNERGSEIGEHSSEDRVGVEAAHSRGHAAENSSYSFSDSGSEYRANRDGRERQEICIRNQVNPRTERRRNKACEPGGDIGRDPAHQRAYQKGRIVAAKHDAHA